MIMETDVLPSTIRSDRSFGSTGGFKSTKSPSDIFATTSGTRFCHTMSRQLDYEDFGDSNISAVEHTQRSLHDYNGTGGFSGSSALIFFIN
jgi:hypothetical protein